MNLKDGIVPIRKEIDDKLAHLIDNTRFIGGSEVTEFEQEFAEFCGVGHAIGCSNGTDALVLALRALGIGNGDEVIVPVNTFVATSEAVTETGAKVRFIDVDTNTALMDPDTLEACLEKWDSKKIKAVIPVHLFGQMVDMPRLRQVADRYSLRIIEDSAQAHGSTFKGHGPGHWGDAATYSFYPGKNLGAFGDAGAVVCNSSILADRIRMSVDHGRLPGEKYNHNAEGGNKRLDTIQAAILRIRLRRLERSNSERRSRAMYYTDNLSGLESLDTPVCLPDSVSAWHLYVVRCDQRDALMEKLRDSGIVSGIHYPIPLHLLHAYKYLGYQKGDFPAAEKIAEKHMSLPLWPEMGKDAQDYVIKILSNELA